MFLSCSNKARRATNNFLIILFVRVFTPENQHDLFLSSLRLCILQHSNSASIAPIPHHPRNVNVCFQPNKPTKRSLSTPQPSNPSKKMTNMTKSNLCRRKSFRLNFFIFSNITADYLTIYLIHYPADDVQAPFKAPVPTPATPPNTPLCLILAATRNEVKDVRGQSQPTQLCIGLADYTDKVRRVNKQSPCHSFCLYFV